MPLLRGMRSSAKYVWILIFIFFVGGFLLLDTSGLLSTDVISPSTAVASVNGKDILYLDWANRVEGESQRQAQLLGRSLTLEELKLVEDRALDEMISELLLREEYRRRGITVTPQEVVDAARSMPPTQLLQAPDLQTDGQFDYDKYLRLLSSSNARASGLLADIEAYYRQEIPRLKLYQQLLADVHVSYEKMWDSWKDVNDSAQVSYVAIPPEMMGDSVKPTVSDAEIRAFYEANKDLYDRPGRALVSVLQIPRVVTAADTAAALAKAEELRAEIVGGASFEEVAERESHDSLTGPNGGDLGRGARGRFIPVFEEAAYALRPGQVSQPVKSDFGFHLIKVDSRAGDTLSVRHILIHVNQSDSAALVMDRRADSLANLAADALEPERFDDAASRLGIVPQQTLSFEGEGLILNGRFVPNVGAWAFSGVAEGESSTLFESEDGYFLARLDSLVQSGDAPLSEVRAEIEGRLLRRKLIDALLPFARQVASDAIATSLEASAAKHGLNVQQTEMFTRLSFVQGMGRDNQAIGAAFALATGAISSPVATEDAVYVMRIDRRVNADRDAWEAQRETQRDILMQSLQQEKLESFMQGLRASANIKDRRKELALLGRTAT